MSGLSGLLHTSITLSLTKLELGLFAVILRQTLEEQGAETGSSSSTEAVGAKKSKSRANIVPSSLDSRVEDKESLETITVVGKLANSLASSVDQLFANSVVTCPGIRVISTVGSRSARTSSLYSLSVAGHSPRA